MADLAAQIAKAKQAGYSDAQIASYLGSDAAMAPKVKAARAAGYSDSDIVGHLGRQSLGDRIYDATVKPVAEAYDHAKAGVVQDFEATKARAKAPPPNPVDAAKQSVAELQRGARFAGDVAGIPLAPIGQALDNYVVKPAAHALSGIPLPAYGDDGKRLTRDQVQTKWEGGVRNALSAVGAPEAGAASRLAPAAAAAPKTSALAETAARFDRAGVSPMLAAGGGKGMSAATNAIAENPIAGVLTRGRLKNAMTQSSASAQNLAGQYGDTRGAQITGENIQKGVQRFARDKDAPQSFAAKATAKYDDVFGKLDTAMAGKTNAPTRTPVYGEGMLSGTKLGETVEGGSQIATPATTQVLNDILNSTQSAALGDLVTDPTLSKAAKAITGAQDAKDMSFGDLRRVRTWVRDAQKDPELRQKIGPANLKRLEGALTQDIYTNADKLGSPELSRQLRRTDQFYAAGQQRIQSALQPFDDAGSGESAYRRLIQAAGSTGSADAQKLLSVKRSLSPDEWGDVAANAVSEMGKPTAGTRAVGEESPFSVNTFVTNYNAFSPRGKDILFGATGGGGKQATQLRASLDNLATVVDDLKGIEKGANTSKSAVSAQTVGTVGGLLNHVTAIPTAIGLGGMALTGEIMTNPLAVRWLTKLVSAAKRGPAPTSIVIKQLGNAAKANAALLPLYRQAPMLLEAPKVSTPASAEQQQTPAQ